MLTKLENQSIHLNKFIPHSTKISQTSYMYTYLHKCILTNT